MACLSVSISHPPLLLAGPANPPKSLTSHMTPCLGPANLRGPLPAAVPRKMMPFYFCLYRVPPAGQSPCFFSLKLSSDKNLFLNPSSHCLGVLFSTFTLWESEAIESVEIAHGHPAPTITWGKKESLLNTKCTPLFLTQNAVSNPSFHPKDDKWNKIHRGHYLIHLYEICVQNFSLPLLRTKKTLDLYCRGDG